jgi:hypothetical protein
MNHYGSIGRGDVQARSTSAHRRTKLPYRILLADIRHRYFLAAPHSHIVRSQEVPAVRRHHASVSRVRDIGVQGRCALPNGLELTSKPWDDFATTSRIEEIGRSEAICRRSCYFGSCDANSRPETNLARRVALLRHRRRNDFGIGCLTVVRAAFGGCGIRVDAGCHTCLVALGGRERSAIRSASPWRFPDRWTMVLHALGIRRYRAK